MQPVHALGVDAAILFADILLPVIPLGLGAGILQRRRVLSSARRFER
jgi:uroporphyrinogen-III decarboxylase